MAESTHFLNPVSLRFLADRTHGMHPAGEVGHVETTRKYGPLNNLASGFKGKNTQKHTGNQYSSESNGVKCMEQSVPSTALCTN